MLNFRITSNCVTLEYKSDVLSNNNWAWSELSKSGSVTVSNTFHFLLADLITFPTPKQNFDLYTYDFSLGTLYGTYIIIPGRKINIKQDLWIDQSINLKRSIFTAERNVSIFGRLSGLLDHNGPIVIGGINTNAIPQDVFEELLEKFPNTYELNRRGFLTLEAISGHFVEFSHPTGELSR